MSHVWEKRAEEGAVSLSLDVKEKRVRQLVSEVGAVEDLDQGALRLLRSPTPQVQVAQDQCEVAQLALALVLVLALAAQE